MSLAIQRTKIYWAVSFKNVLNEGFLFLTKKKPASTTKVKASQFCYFYKTINCEVIGDEFSAISIDYNCFKVNKNIIC